MLLAMSGRETFRVEVPGGVLAGWSEGDGTPVLLLHGGPGLGYVYLEELFAELSSEFRIAAYQQRGLAPSTTEGPFTVAQSIDDVLAVLDALGWNQALLVGHSWGGHLALRVAAAHPDRLIGALAVDPLGVVGDGGVAHFEAEMIARTPKESRERAHELDQRAMAGDGTEEEALESLRLVWPAYFADPESAPEMPPITLSVDAYAGVFGDLATGLEHDVVELAAGKVAYGVLAGGSSPMPWGQAARASVEISPRAFLQVVPGGGHMPWYESPGCVLSALRRLSA
jgi:pimeloyl-ACP methyl ester carboxylesterase